jgi:hypothetical protein
MAASTSTNRAPIIALSIASTYKMCYIRLLMLILLFSSIELAVENAEELCAMSSCQMMLITTIFLMINAPDLFGGLGMEYEAPRQSQPHRTRVCHTVMSIFTEMGPGYVWHAYWMDAVSFWKLHSILLPGLEKREKKRSKKKKKHRNGAKNGLITTSV